MCEVLSEGLGDHLGSTFITNAATACGGAIGFSGTQALIYDSNFTSNKASLGGGLCSDFSGEVVSLLDVIVVNGKVQNTSFLYLHWYTLG